MHDLLACGEEKRGKKRKAWPCWQAGTRKEERKQKGERHGSVGSVCREEGKKEKRRKGCGAIGWLVRRRWKEEEKGRCTWRDWLVGRVKIIIGIKEEEGVIAVSMIGQQVEGEGRMA